MREISRPTREDNPYEVCRDNPSPVLSLLFTGGGPGVTEIVENRRNIVSGGQK
jgi:hypothetical protein